MRKKLLFLMFLVAVFSSPIIAQNYTVTPGSISISVDLDDSQIDHFDIVAEAHISNITSDSLYLKWERIMNEKSDCWETAVCDINLCYLPNVSSKEFILPPNFSNGEMLVHAYPNNTPGESFVKIKISNLNDEADTLVITYDFTATGGELCIIDGVSQVELEALKIFPNPATNYFRLTNTNEIQEVVVYNILGRKVRIFDVTDNQSYNISDLPNGVYLVGLIDKNQKTLKTLRLQKH